MFKTKDKKSMIECFGSRLFSNDVMKQYMSEETYSELNQVINSTKTLYLDLANRVAEAMKNWALANGATHYTHWFQPLTGETAEKHDSFISIDKEGNTILEFTGKSLCKGEADASSFPSGGIRATFEARGYTVWDCTSPAFIKKSKNEIGVLCIPTAFCSYNGEALDKKTPLLRSLEALDKQGVRLLRLLGIDCNHVLSSVGGEQEYFLIDKDDYNKRIDLKFTGRTLFGALPPKGQEQNDQYYACIRERVSAFMGDLNLELWELGITAKTQHNEVAPSQHELAPIFSPSNIAADQNQLIMETMKKIADKHNLACLLHEKPFNGVSGSGKHNNWSISTDSGMNLLKPGKAPAENRIFLLFISIVMSAVDDYADLIRLSAANPGNDYRLGGHEAPPSIISIYLGDDLEFILDGIEAGKTVASAVKESLPTGASCLAEVFKDTSDRNRTSPFAFTGNKFEFRMVGSSATLSNPNTMLNTITAEVMGNVVDMIEEKIATNDNMQSIILSIIKQLYTKHKRILYKGNNYTKEWAKEAKKRGLCNLNNCIDVYDVLLAKKNIDLFEKHKVMTKTEIYSRRDIYIETYIKTINVEANTMDVIINKYILPVAMQYCGKLAKNVVNLKAVSTSFGVCEEKCLSEIQGLIASIIDSHNVLIESHQNAEKCADLKKKAIIYRDQVKTGLEDVRVYIDRLEKIMPKDKWPFPDYADILFYE